MFMETFAKRKIYFYFWSQSWELIINNFLSFLIRLGYEVGHNGINLIKIDPLHIPSILIKQGTDSPVNVELKFTDVDLTGLTQFRFTKME